MFCRRYFTFLLAWLPFSAAAQSGESAGDSVRIEGEQAELLFQRYFSSLSPALIARIGNHKVTEVKTERFSCFRLRHGEAYEPTHYLTYHCDFSTQELLPFGIETSDPLMIGVGN